MKVSYQSKKNNLSNKIYVCLKFLSSVTVVWYFKYNITNITKLQYLWYFI